MGRLLWRCDTVAEVAETATVGGACKLEACGAEVKASPSMSGDILCFKSSNAAHIEARVTYGFSLVAKSPGNRVGINMGYCYAVLILTNSIAIAADGAKGPPLPTVLATTTRRARKELAKGVPVRTPIVWKVARAAPRAARSK